MSGLSLLGTSYEAYADDHGRCVGAGFRCVLRRCGIAGYWQSAHGANSRLRSGLLQEVASPAARLSARPSSHEPALAALGGQSVPGRTFGLRWSGLGRPQSGRPRIREASTCVVARRRPGGSLARAFPVQVSNWRSKISQLDRSVCPRPISRRLHRIIYLGSDGERLSSRLTIRPEESRATTFLIFRWRAGRTDFALGLQPGSHSSVAFATLRQMAISI